MYVGLDVWQYKQIPVHVEQVLLPFRFRSIFQRLGMSNKNICLLGIVMGICGSVVIADWQSVGGDPCDQYSYEELKSMSTNMTSSDSCGGGGTLCYVSSAYKSPFVGITWQLLVVGFSI